MASVGFFGLDSCCDLRSRGGGADLKAAARFCLISNFDGPPGHSDRFLRAGAPMHEVLMSLSFAWPLAAPATSRTPSRAARTGNFLEADMLPITSHRPTRPPGGR